MGMSIPPAVSAQGGLVGWEGPFDLSFRREDDDSRGEGRNVLEVDSDNFRSGLLGVPRISAIVKVPGSENSGRFAVEDGRLEIWEEFLEFLTGPTGPEKTRPPALFPPHPTPQPGAAWLFRHSLTLSPLRPPPHPYPRRVPVKNRS